MTQPPQHNIPCNYFIFLVYLQDPAQIHLKDSWMAAITFYPSRFPSQPMSLISAICERGSKIEQNQQRNANNLKL